LRLSYLLAVVSLASFAVVSVNGVAPHIFPLIGIGVAFGGMNMALWALLPPVIRADLDEVGRRTEAMPTGLFLLALKLAAGLSASLLGVALDLVGLAAASPGDLGFGQRLTAVMTLLPSLGLVLAFVLVGLLSRNIGRPDQNGTIT